MSQSSELTLVRLPETVALHARPAGAFVRAAASFTAAIEVEANGRRANAKSILEILGPRSRRRNGTGDLGLRRGRTDRRGRSPAGEPHLRALLNDVLRRELHRAAKARHSARRPPSPTRSDVNSGSPRGLAADLDGDIPTACAAWIVRRMNATTAGSAAESGDASGSSRSSPRVRRDKVVRPDRNEVGSECELAPNGSPRAAVLDPSPRAVAADVRRSPPHGAEASALPEAVAADLDEREHDSQLCSLRRPAGSQPAGRPARPGARA